MTTVAERLRQVNVKVERAKKHHAELKREIKAFLDTKPYRIEAKKNVDTRIVYYVSSAQPTPDALSVITGDMIQNLVSALDHLAYQLVGSDTNDAWPAPKHIYFPIADTRANFAALLQGPRDRLQGASAATKSAVDTLRPYKGGTDNFWILQQLNNLDKHRTLMTVGAGFLSVDIGKLAEVELPGNPKFTLRIAPADPMIPLKAGDELFIDSPGKKPVNMPFEVDIALEEKPVVTARSLYDFLGQLLNTVESAVTALAPHLKQTP